MHLTCHSKLSSTTVIPYEIAVKRFSINTKRAGDNKMSRKSDSVSHPRCRAASLRAQHFGEIPTRKGKGNGPDFYQAIKSAMSSECPVSRPVAAAGLVKSQRNAQVSVTSNHWTNKQPPTQSSHHNQRNHPPTYSGQAFQCFPLLPWVPSSTLCIIDGNFKTCLKNFTHLPDLQFVCFVLLCVRLTLILMDQTYGKAREWDLSPCPGLPCRATGANVLII